MKPFLLLIISACLVAISCKKEPERVISKTDLLTSKAWVVQKAEQKLHTNPWEDTYPAWQDCEKDDKWIFRADLSLELNDAANPCSGSPNRIIDIQTWAFSDNETKIVIDGATLTIEALNETTLVLYASETVGGILYQTRLTLIH